MNPYFFYPLLVLGSIVWVVGLVALCLSVVGFYNLFVGPQKLRGKANTATILVIPVCFMVAILLLSPPFFTETVFGHHMVLANSGEIRRVFEKPIFMWQKNYDKFVEGAELLRYDWGKYDTSVTMTVSPITDNPKVRELTDTVMVGWINTPEAYAAYWVASAAFAGRHALEDNSSWGDATKRLNQFVRFNLYEFNEKNSRKLAEFYNPLDSAQQKEFRDLVASFLGEKFRRAGVRITWRSLTLNANLLPVV